MQTAKVKFSKNDDDDDDDVIHQERGFLSEAVAEFLCQLGWSREEGGEGGGGGGGGGGEEERERGEEEGEGGGGGGGESLEELASQFSLSRVSRSPARVDEGKLMWINKKHYRRRLHDPASSAELAKDLAERVNTTLRYIRLLGYIQCVYSCGKKFRILQLQCVLVGLVSFTYDDRCVCENFNLLVNLLTIIIVIDHTPITLGRARDV